MVDIWRASAVRMYYATEKSRTTSTPEPFCECRVFLFFKEKPTTAQLGTVRKRLSSILDIMENSLKSIKAVKELEEERGEQIIERDNRFSDEDIHVVKEGSGEIKIKINGFEIEDMDDDAMKGLETLADEGLKFGRFYKYLSFRGADGQIKYEANDEDVTEIIAESREEGSEG
jgi:hypothetical protein